MLQVERQMNSHDGLLKAWQFALHNLKSDGPVVNSYAAVILFEVLDKDRGYTGRALQAIEDASISSHDATTLALLNEYRQVLLRYRFSAPPHEPPHNLTQEL